MIDSRFTDHHRVNVGVVNLLVHDFYDPIIAVLTILIVYLVKFY